MQFYGTLGPACARRETLCAMFRAGMTGIRLNLSHTSLPASGDLLGEYFAAAKECGVQNPRLVLDLQGPEIRIGALETPIELLPGSPVLLVEDASAPHISQCPCIPFPAALLPKIEPGQEIFLDDSAFLLRAKLQGAEGVICTVERGGVLKSRKSAALPGLEAFLPTLTPTDRANLMDGALAGVTDVLQPFVRGKADLDALRSALDTCWMPDARIIAKIENQQGVEKLDEIIAGCDEICIARGDLGNGMPLWQLPRLQKEISARCRAAGRDFMVVTQLLHSMQQSAVPTRAEVSDIYNAVLDGASSLMLTGETAAGAYPAKAMEYLVKTANSARE